jgi:acetyl-CoA acetyltransferase
MAQDVYIIGTAMTKFCKQIEKGVKTLTGEALELVLKDCWLERRDMEAEYVHEWNRMYRSRKEGMTCENLRKKASLMVLYSESTGSSMCRSPYSTMIVLP